MSLSPSNINVSLIENILQESVTSIDVTDAVPLGENFNSNVYRVTAVVKSKDGSPRKKQIIVKIGLKRDPQLSVAYKREECMYRSTLKKMMNLIPKGANIPRFFPEFLWSSQDENELLALEDLQLRDFKMRDRQLMMDLPHCKLAIKKIAVLHGLSFILLQENPQSISVYDDWIYNTPMGSVPIQMFMNSIVLLEAESFEEWGVDGVRLSKKLKAIINTVRLDIYQNIKYKEDQFNVINHCDLWNNNFMFHYDEETEELDDCILIDYQFAYVTSPAVDVIHFLFCNMNNEILLDEFDCLIHEYHTELSRVLTACGYGHKMLSLEKLRADIDSHMILGIMILLLGTPVALHEAMKWFRRDWEENEIEKIKTFLRNDYVSARFRKAMMYFEEKGLL